MARTTCRSPSPIVFPAIEECGEPSIQRKFPFIEHKPKREEMTCQPPGSRQSSVDPRPASRRLGSPQPAGLRRSPQPASRRLGSPQPASLRRSPQPASLRHGRRRRSDRRLDVGRPRGRPSQVRRRGSPDLCHVRDLAKVRRESLQECGHGRGRWRHRPKASKRVQAD